MVAQQGRVLWWCELVLECACTDLVEVQWVEWAVLELERVLVRVEREWERG